MAVARVLILDDELLIAMLLHNWLEELGYEPIGPANTVAQAVALVENDRPDAAILDVSLHKTDCYPAADVLKARNTPFAFGTGRDEQTIAPRHADVPMLRKPYDKTALELVMGELLLSEFTDCQTTERKENRKAHPPSFTNFSDTAEGARADPRVTWPRGLPLDLACQA